MNLTRGPSEKYAYERVGEEDTCEHPRTTRVGRCVIVNPEGCGRELLLRRVCERSGGSGWTEAD